MSAHVIRPVQASEVAAVYQVWQTLRAYYASVDERIIPSPVSEHEFTADFHRRLSRTESATFVAVEGKRIVGLITGAVEANQPDRLPEQHVTIGHVYVDPAHRRSGLGRGLFEALANWAADLEGVSHIEMPVLAADGDAGHFWQSLGFSPFIQRLWAPLNLPDEDA
jgi:GNAT superfamily N-acetyltransferase